MIDKSLDMAKFLFYNNKVIYNKLQDKLVNPSLKIYIYIYKNKIN